MQVLVAVELRPHAGHFDKEKEGMGQYVRRTVQVPSF